MSNNFAGNTCARIVGAAVPLLSRRHPIRTTNRQMHLFWSLAPIYVFPSGASSCFRKTDYTVVFSVLLHPFLSFRPYMKRFGPISRCLCLMPGI